MKETRLPINHLSELEILNSPRMTQAIISAWVARMIDAGWGIYFSENGMGFRHEDEPVELSTPQAEGLLNVYWHRLEIPTPYNYLEVAKKPLIKINQECRPD